MKLNKLSALKSLDTLPLVIRSKVFIDKSLLSEIEIILYTTKLCLFSTKVLTNEIRIENKNETLSIINSELGKLYNLLSKKDILIHSRYTKNDINKFLKKNGIK